MHQIFDMHQYRRVVELVIFGEQRNRLFDGHDAVALRARRLAHGRRAAKLRIDRSGVPVRRELIAFRTAPLVHPRGVVDDRLAVEPLVQIGPGLFRKVLFGDTGHRRMAQTPPRKEILRRTQCCRQREQQNRSLHVCSFFGSSGICPVLNIYGSGGKKFSPRCYFLNVPINFFG